MRPPTTCVCGAVLETILDKAKHSWCGWTEEDVRDELSPWAPRRKKGTPGPWKVEGEGDLVRGIVDLLISGPDDEWVCNVDWTDGQEERHRADARLIAAAPDLLTWAEAVTSWVTDKDELVLAMGLLREAVKKAKDGG